MNMKNKNLPCFMEPQPQETESNIVDIRFHACDVAWLPSRVLSFVVVFGAGCPGGRVVVYRGVAGRKVW